jgi:hypothetical protein
MQSSEVLVRQMPGNQELAAHRRESCSRAPELDDDATKNTWVQSEAPRVYKCIPQVITEI